MNICLFDVTQSVVVFLLVARLNVCPFTFSVAVTSTLSFVHVSGFAANFMSFESSFGTILVFASNSFDAFFCPFFPIATAFTTNVVSCFSFVYVNFGLLFLLS